MGLVFNGTSGTDKISAVDGTLTIDGVATINSITSPIITGDLSISDTIVHTGDTNTKIRFPSADTFTVETAGSERIRIDSSGKMGLGTNNPNNPLTIHASGNHIFLKDTATNNVLQIRHASGVAEFNSYDLDGNARRDYVFNQYSSEVLRIDSGGRLLLGTNTNSSPIGWNNNLQVAGTNAQAGISIRRDENGTGGALLIFGKSRGSLNGNTAVQSGDQIGGMYFAGADGTDVNSIAAQISVEVDGTPGGNDMPGRLIFKTTADNAASPTERLRIDKNGNMCLGGTPFAQGTGNTFCIHSSGTGGGDHAYIYFTNGDSGHTASDGMSIGIAANQVANIAVREAWPFAISTNGSERMRFLTDGEIVMGTANSGSADTLYVTGPANSGQSTVKILGNGNNSPQANTCALDVQQNCDGAPNTSPALKLTHTNTLAGTEGAIMSIYTNTNNGTAQTGWVYHTTGRIIHNRPSTDGTLFSFRHNSSSEGNIAISGSTVSYNGGHLSRWSQFVGLSTTSKAARPTIYQGTVLSNLDEMCEWTGEDNQQLNKTKVSDTVGDKDVAGVFWTWDEEDDETGYVNDFYVAMTGDMVIRVAGSTSVARGDLLESAGDGTAKPQSDDIVRSKTIAKIISTTSTATYADGSKAYPCVLMAC